MPGDLICDLFISQLEVTISTFEGAMPCFTIPKRSQIRRIARWICFVCLEF